MTSQQVAALSRMLRHCAFELQPRHEYPSPLFAHVRPCDEQLTLQPPQRVLVVIDTHEPLQQTRPLPHPVPFVTDREHERDSPLFTFWHEPLRHRRRVRVRDCVPVVSHAFEKPPQLPQLL